MGEAFKLECGTCHYNSIIYEGIGFMYISLKSIASFVTDPALKQVIGEFMEDGSVSYDAHQALYVCPQCDGIQNELYIEMKSDRSQYRRVCNCKRCGAEMERTPIEHNVPIRLTCPDCRESELMATSFMDWD